MGKGRLGGTPGIRAFQNVVNPPLCIEGELAYEFPVQGIQAGESGCAPVWQRNDNLQHPKAMVIQDRNGYAEILVGGDKKDGVAESTGFISGGFVLDDWFY
jgi:hypothetical protein